MSTGRVHAGFFTKQVLGSDLLRDNWYEASRDYARDLGGKIIGECVIDSALNGLGITDDAAAINERKLTITGAGLSALSDAGDVFNAMGSTATLSQLTEGARTITLNDPDWFIDLPYENANGTSYFVYLKLIEFPIDVSVSATGGRGYGRFVEAPGIVVNPDSVSDSGTELEFVVDTDLTALGIQRWLTANAEDDDWSYDCVVWLDTDTTGVDIATDDPDVAIAFDAKLWKRSGNPEWLVSLAGLGDGYLGQSSYDTDASHYKIAILGPIITTTDYDADPDYVLVGQVDSATGSETISTGGQIVVDSFSTILSSFAATMAAIHERGWITYPTVTVTSPTQLDISANGQAFVNGSLSTPPLKSFTSGFSSTATHYVYYDADPATNAYVMTTTAADCFDASQTQRVPVVVFDTDGSSQIVSATVIKNGKQYAKFTNTMRLTVSQETEHNAMFVELDAALAFAAAVNASSDPDRAVLIEIIGDVTQTSSISDDNIFGLKNVTIRGGSGGSVSNTSAGGRIIWSFTGAPLFAPGVTVHGWTFENLTFRYGGTGSADSESIFGPTAGSLHNVKLVNCFVDGNSIPTSGAGGSLAHVFNLTGVAAASRDLKIIDCEIYTNGCLVYLPTAASGIVTDMTIRNTIYRQGTGIGTVSGFLYLADAGTYEKIRVVDCEIETDDVAIFIGDDCQDVWIKDCKITASNPKVIHVGVAGASNEPELWVKGCRLVSSVAPSSTGEGVIEIYGFIDVDIPVRIENCVIDGAAGSYSRGIAVNEGESAAANGTGIHVSGCSIKDVTVGILSETSEGNVIIGNTIRASVAGIMDGGDPNNTPNPSIQAMNLIRISAATNGVGIDVQTSQSTTQGSRHMQLFNSVVFTTADASHVGYDFRGNAVGSLLINSVFSGNSVVNAGIGVALYTENSSVFGNLVHSNTTNECVLMSISGATYAMKNTSMFGNVLEDGKGIIGDASVTLNSTVFGNIADVASGQYAFDLILNNSCYALNISDSAGIVNLSYSSAPSTVVGNVHPGTGQDFPKDTIPGPMVGNVIGQFGATATPTSACLVGNYVSGAFTLTGPGNASTVVGNYIGGTFASGLTDGTYVGNRFASGLSITLSNDDFVFVGNELNQSSTLNLSGDNSIIVGNNIRNSTLNDTGTGNMTVTATDSDPLNKV